MICVFRAGCANLKAISSLRSDVQFCNERTGPNCLCSESPAELGGAPSLDTGFHQIAA
jgi:hypothetical protein